MYVILLHYLIFLIIILGLNRYNEIMVLYIYVIYIYIYHISSLLI